MIIRDEQDINRQIIEETANKLDNSSLIKKSIDIEDSESVRDDMEEVDRVAAQIQASLNRKKENRKVIKPIMKEPVEEKIYSDSEEFEEDTEESSEEALDIDLDDPEVDKAATKIQATFKGKKARQEVAKIRKDNEAKAEEGSKGCEKSQEVCDKEFDIDLEDPEVDAAAAKIQSSFKGKKVSSKVAEGRNAKEDEAKKEEIDIDKVRRI